MVVNGRTDTEDAADEVACLDEPCHAGGRSGEVAASEEQTGDTVQPWVFRRVRWPCQKYNDLV